MVDIPVVSSLETALLVSSAIGRAVGLVAIDETMAATLRELVRRYGYGDRVVGVSTIDPPVTEFELDRAFAGSPELVERFTAHARGMVVGGCDVIIPAEGVVNTVLVRNKLDAVDGTPVLDSYGSLLAFAEMLVQLRRRSRLSIGRRGAYAKPPESLVRHLRRMTVGALQDSEARRAP